MDLFPLGWLWKKFAPSHHAEAEDGKRMHSRHRKILLLKAWQDDRR